MISCVNRQPRVRTVTHRRSYVRGAHGEHKRPGGAEVGTVGSMRGLLQVRRVPLPTGAPFA